MTVFVSEGFDYGNYNGWTTATYNGSLAVNSASAFQGSNDGLQSATSGINTYAAIFHTVTSSAIVYHRAYYKLDGMPSSGGLARVVLGGIYDSGYTNAVNPCIRNIGGNLYWELAVVVNGSITFTTESTASNPAANTWYCIEILRDLTNQRATLWIDGTQKVNVTGLSQVNNSVSVEVGLDACDYSTPGSTTCYVDAVVAGNAYNGTTTYNLTIQQGTGGTTNPTNGVYTESYSGKQETITATPNSGYTFSYWNVDGSNAGSTNPYTITMNSNHTIQPVFTSGGGSDLTVTGNLTVDGNAIIDGAINTGVIPQTQNNNTARIGHISNAGQQDATGSIRIQLGGGSNPFFAVDNSGLTFDIFSARNDGRVAANNNILNDGSGNATFGGLVTTGLAGLQIGNGTISWNNTYLYGFVFTPPIEFQNDVQFDYVQTFYDTGDYLYYSNGGTSVQNRTPASRNSYLHVFCSTVSPYNLSTVENPFLYVDQSIFAENDIQSYGALSSLSDPQKLAANPSRGGGGVLILGHGYTNPSVDQPIILLADAQSNFNTIWLKASPPSSMPPEQASYAVNWPWGNLALGSLTFNQGNNAQVTLNTGYTTQSGYNIAFIMPSVAPVLSGGNWLGGVGLGTTNYFWNYVDSAYYFAKHTSIIQFDTLDDLAIVKNSKGKQVGDKQVIDLDSMPHLRPDSKDKTDEIDIGKAIGFSIGCHKASALKHDEHDATIANLLTRIEKLEGMLKEKPHA